MGGRERVFLTGGEKEREERREMERERERCERIAKGIFYVFFYWQFFKKKYSKEKQMNIRENKRNTGMLARTRGCPVYGLAVMLFGLIRPFSVDRVTRMKKHRKT